MLGRLSAATAKPIPQYFCFDGEFDFSQGRHMMASSLVQSASIHFESDKS